MKTPKNNGGAQKRVAMVGYRMTEVPEAKEKPKINKKRLVIISISAALAVALVIGIFAAIFRNDSFDYMKDDLKEYITLSEGDYKDYTLEIKFDTVTDRDVDRRIMKLLYQNKANDPSNNGAGVSDTPITLGDTVKIYYRGYTVDEFGREQDIEGASNMLGSVYSLGVGSAAFVSGFEEGLIGALPADHRFTSAQNVFKEGAVASGDVIYLSYSVMYPDGRTAQKSGERIDLDSPDIDKYYGEGFREYFESSNIIIGSKISDGQVFNYENGTAIYFDMTVEAAIRCENQPFTVEARFPANYREKSLRGAEVKYDVYFESAVVFDTPEYNEQFITETLKMTAEALEGFEGETLLDKHRAYLFAEAVAENERIREELIEEAVWERFKAVVTLKKSLPQSEVESACELYYEEMYLEYLTKYSAAYSSFDEYAFARYGTDDIQSLIKSEAESLVFQNIIVYYMIREEKLLPSEENYEKIYAEITGEHLDYYASSNYAAELSKITDEAEKEKRISEIESEMMDYYGEDYFCELVYYANAYTNIISYANIIEIQ